MMEKVCSKCKLSLPIEQFIKRKRAVDGLNGICTHCRKLYWKQYAQKIKPSWLKRPLLKRKGIRNGGVSTKKRFSCSVCGENHPACIQFHHHNDDKKSDVSLLVNNGSKKTILDEVAKCTVLCANCHAKEHWNQKQAEKNNNMIDVALLLAFTFMSM